MSVRKARIAALTVAMLSTTLTSANAKEYPEVKDIPSELLKAFADVVTTGEGYVDARYRNESVDSDAFGKNSHASTLRSRVGYRTKEVHYFSGLVEIEDITSLGSENYDNGGATSSDPLRPVVADPVGTEVSQAFVQFSGINDTKVKYGRYALARGNHRFIGDMNWRQSGQSHDGVTVTNNSINDTEIFYGFTYNVNTAFGSDDPAGDLKGNNHFAEVIYSGLKAGDIKAYTYFLDFDTSTTLSSVTYGASFVGSTMLNDDVTLHYHAEYAQQEDNGKNAIVYDANYIHAMLGATFKGVTVAAGYEQLGSDDGIIAFSTPLATTHRFNGWADQFTATPAAGLQDIYGSINYTIDTGIEILDGTTLTAAFHDFSSDEGSTDYGQEWNFDLQRDFLKYYNFGVRYAHYDTDGSAVAGVDVDKLIFTFGFKYN